MALRNVHTWTKKYIRHPLNFTLYSGVSNLVVLLICAFVFFLFLCFKPHKVRIGFNRCYCTISTLQCLSNLKLAYSPTGVNVKGKFSLKVKTTYRILLSEQEESTSYEILRYDMKFSIDIRVYCPWSDLRSYCLLQTKQFWSSSLVEVVGLK